MADEKADKLRLQSIRFVGDEPEGERDFGIIPSGQVTFYRDFEPRSEATADLEKTLEHLKKQVAELQEAARTGDEVSEELKRIEALAATIESAGEIGKKLSADVVLPSSKDLRVRLVPSDSLDRLEEYRSDESKAFLLTGAFLGATLGTLSNWVTQEAFEFTKASVVFMGFFVGVALLAGTWALQIGKRARRLKRRLLGGHDEEIATGTLETEEEPDT